MSLSAIQDNLLKSSLVQQTQAKGDDVVRGHENAAAVVQREQGRQQDQVVLSLREAEHGSIRSDEEKKRGREEKDDKDDEEGKDGSRRGKKPEEEEEDQGPRAKMRTIDVVI